jgi:hypothetical protein
LKVIFKAERFSRDAEKRVPVNLHEKLWLDFLRKRPVMGTWMT